MNEKETANHKGNKQQKDILKDLLVYSKKLKQKSFAHLMKLYWISLLVCKDGI